MNVLQIQWKRRCKQILSYLLCLLVGFLAGIAIECVIYFGDGANNAVPLGMFVAMFGLGMPHVIAASLYLTLEFQLAVTMGVTRKNFVRNYLSLAVPEMAAYYVLFFLIYQFEKVLWGKTLGLPMAEEVLAIMEVMPICLATGLIGLLVIELLSGALMMRFGPKIFWVYWLICMTPTFLAHTDIKLPTITLPAGMVAIVTDAGATGICGLIVIVEVLLFLLAYKMLKRQQIA